ncbi:hypothetical protein SUGI_0593040 [Cryptomeria japonica]|nr:hypothetical protein SUGI_0593040 [Cryptomeria japonica]
MDEHMEDGSAAPAGGGNIETSEASEGLRRRGNSLKRKNSASSSTPSKRLAKDRSPLPPLHNGGVKTRQSPIKMAAAQQKAPIVSPPFKSEDTQMVTLAAKPVVVGGDSKQEDEKMDQAIAAVASMELSEDVLKDENAHIVPTPSGWFSWTRIHTLEKRVLASFFDGKSKTRNPDMYLEIRNSIMKRYHRNPHKQIVLTDLSDIISEDNDAVREIMDFLNHWGLINFRPLPSCQQDGPIAKEDLDSSTENIKDEIDKTTSGASVLEKMYSFEKVSSRSRKKTSAATASVSMPTPVLTAAAIPDVLVGPQGPAVEYHCNSCQADCSTKRYHCQKQADFDLCSECFSAEKFGAGMASTDFILMEPMTERAGVSGGSWTDQETLLLLEALELYGDNWNEIAEHVATKSKAQCILHFIRLPIEDPFLEDKDMPDTIIQGSLETVSGNRDLTIAAPQNNSESPIAKSSSSEELPGVSKNDDAKSKQVDEGQPSEKIVENDAVKAVIAAFQAVGVLSGSEESLSFAEAGNPVMALVAFLAAMVGRELAAASAQSALKAIHDNTPAMQLAAKHCFRLGDPLDDSKDENTNSRPDAQELENESVSLEHGKSPDEDPPKKVDESAISDALKETETLETSASLQESQVGPGSSNSTMTNGENTGKVDPEQACSASGEKTDKVDLEQICSPNEKKYPEDSIEVEDSHSMDTEKNANEKKSPEDLVVVEDSHSLDNLKSKTEEKCVEDSTDVEDADHLDKMKRAAITVLSGAAVKAKLLADQEEEHIQQLVTEVINNELKKLDIKLRHFRELESALGKAREQIEREKHRLLMEQANLVAARFGLSAAQPRSSSLPSAIGNSPTVALSRFPLGGGLRSIANTNAGTAKPPLFTSPVTQIRNVAPPPVPSSSAPATSSAAGVRVFAEGNFIMSDGVA